jgi:hypothetical protein
MIDPRDGLVDTSLNTLMRLGAGIRMRTER